MNARPALQPNRPASVSFAVVLLGLLMLGPVMLGRAGAQTGEDSGLAALRIAHLPGELELHVLIDGRRVFENLLPPLVTDYLLLPAGEHRLELAPADPPQDSARPVVSLSINLAPGSYHTYVTLLAGAFEPGAQVPDMTILELVDDYSQVPPPGRALLRTVHATPGGPVLNALAVPLTRLEGSSDQADQPRDAATAAQALASELAPASSSPYLPFPADVYRLQVISAESARLLLEVPDLGLEPGAVYTLFLFGGEDEGALRATLAIDALLDAGILRD